MIINTIHPCKAVELSCSKQIALKKRLHPDNRKKKLCKKVRFMSYHVLRTLVDTKLKK